MEMSINGRCNGAVIPRTTECYKVCLLALCLTVDMSDRTPERQKPKTWYCGFVPPISSNFITQHHSAQSMLPQEKHHTVLKGHIGVIKGAGIFRYAYRVVKATLSGHGLYRVISIGPGIATPEISIQWGNSIPQCQFDRFYWDHGGLGNKTSLTPARRALLRGS
jgi:hypothetical protein